MSDAYDSAKENRDHNDAVLVATKENFWNYIERSYPKMFKIFADWIDDYKKRVNWEELYSVHYWSLREDRPMRKADYDTHEREECTTKRYKFHDIPIAMQFGIFCQFAQELPDKKHDFAPDVRDMESFGQSITEWLSIEEFGTEFNV